VASVFQKVQYHLAPWVLLARHQQRGRATIISSRAAGALDARHGERAGPAGSACHL
jgi:hypothetical protein